LKVSSWKNRLVSWFVPCRADSTPGWISSKIIGGPEDPSEVRRGVTMRLMCEARIDKLAPKHLLGRQNILGVAFTLENYSRHWYLLAETADESSSSSSASDGSDFSTGS
jgi:hypothetical protein